MAYDDVISLIGEFGRYQRRIYLLLFLPAICAGIHTMSGVFLGARTDFRCLLPPETLENATYQLPSDIMNVAYPWDNTTATWSQCERYDKNLIDGNFSSTTSTVKCTAFVYDKTTYELTTTTEFNLVCDKAWLKATADSLFMVGLMLGSTVFGGLSDRYGRKPIFYLTIIVQTIGGLLVAVSPNLISYMVFRLILGTSANAIIVIAYIIGVEMVTPKSRLAVGVGVQLFATIGYVLTTGFAYFFTNWRILQIAITIPSVVFLVYWWLIPESVRWLLTKERLEEAKDLLLKASSENKVELSRTTLDGMLNNNAVTQPATEKSSPFDLFKYPNLRRKSLILFFNWFANSVTYYGISWNTSNLVGNHYVNFAIAGLVEIPAEALVFFTLNRWGRKIILCDCMVLAGISLLLTTFVPADMSWLMVLLAMVGKLAITSSYVIVYIFTAEQYPTVIRSVGVGVCSTCAHIGGVMSPYIIYSSSIWTHLPFVMFGVFSLIGGLSALLLPETLNKKLPESIDDGESFGKKRWSS